MVALNEGWGKESRRNTRDVKLWTETQTAIDSVGDVAEESLSGLEDVSLEKLQAESKEQKPMARIIKGCVWLLQQMWTSI